MIKARVAQIVTVTVVWLVVFVWNLEVCRGVNAAFGPWDEHVLRGVVAGKRVTGRFASSQFVLSPTNLGRQVNMRVSSEIYRSVPVGANCSLTNWSVGAMGLVYRFAWNHGKIHCTHGSASSTN